MSEKANPTVDVAADDIVLPFSVESLGIRGRVVRMGALSDDILSRHAYPAPVSALLAEAVSLTAMLGTSLKFDGKFILQTSSDGPVDMIVADFVSPNRVRGYARFDKEKISALESEGKITPQQLLGKGHLALTIDQGADMERYQGIVSLDGGSLSDGALEYFARSEQIPTALKVTAGPMIVRGNSGIGSWRGGAIMVQHMPESGEPSPLPTSSGDVPEGVEDTIVEDDNWVKARYLLETVEHHELLDPTLTPETLLYRLFHEDGARVFPAIELERHCTCSEKKISQVLLELFRRRAREHGRGWTNFRFLRILFHNIHIPAGNGLALFDAMCC